MRRRTGPAYRDRRPPPPGCLRIPQDCWPSRCADEMKIRRPLWPVDGRGVAQAVDFRLGRPLFSRRLDSRSEGKARLVDRRRVSAIKPLVSSGIVYLRGRGFWSGFSEQIFECGNFRVLGAGDGRSLITRGETLSGNLDRRGERLGGFFPDSLPYRTFEREY